MGKSMKFNNILFERIITGICSELKNEVEKDIEDNSEFKIILKDETYIPSMYDLHIALGLEIDIVILNPNI